jgi:hypothetical protein
MMGGLRVFVKKILLSASSDPACHAGLEGKAEPPGGLPKRTPDGHRLRVADPLRMAPHIRLMQIPERLDEGPIALHHGPVADQIGRYRGLVEVTSYRHLAHTWVRASAHVHIRDNPLHKLDIEDRDA